MRSISKLDDDESHRYISINGWFVKWLSSHSNSIMATIAVWFKSRFQFVSFSALYFLLFFFFLFFERHSFTTFFSILIYNVYAVSLLSPTHKNCLWMNYILSILLLWKKKNFTSWIHHHRRCRRRRLRVTE